MTLVNFPIPGPKFLIAHTRSGRGAGDFRAWPRKGTRSGSDSAVCGAAVQLSRLRYLPATFAEIVLVEMSDQPVPGEADICINDASAPLATANKLNIVLQPDL